MCNVKHHSSSPIDIKTPMEEENPKGGEAPGNPHIRPLYHTMFLIYQSFVGGKKVCKIKRKQEEEAP